MIKTKHGDLLDSTETYLCHQCNCYSTRSAHLARSVFKRFPYADIYTERKSPDQPGTVILRGDGGDQRYVANLLGQVYPGVSRYPEGKLDGSSSRLRYFKKCLEDLSDLEGSFAFPYRIGCGAAGGEWEDYLAALEKFAEQVPGDVVIYRLDPLPQTQSSHPTLF